MIISGTIDLRGLAQTQDAPPYSAQATARPVRGGIELRVGKQIALVDNLNSGTARDARHRAEQAGFSQLAYGLANLADDLEALETQEMTRATFKDTFEAVASMMTADTVDLGGNSSLTRSSDDSGRTLTVKINQPEAAELAITVRLGGKEPSIELSGRFSNYGGAWQAVDLEHQAGQRVRARSTAPNGHVSYGRFATTSLTGATDLKLTPGLERVLELLAPAMPELRKFGMHNGENFGVHPRLESVDFIVQNTPSELSTGDVRRLRQHAAFLPRDTTADHAFDDKIGERVRANPERGFPVTVAGGGTEIQYSVGDRGAEITKLAAELRTAEFAAKPRL